MRSRLPLIVVFFALIIMCGCCTMHRSARIHDGLSVALNGGLIMEAGDEPFPLGQIELRYGQSATENCMGQSIGVIIPRCIRLSCLELYLEMPRHHKYNMGFGGWIGIIPSVFHIVGIPLGQKKEAEIFLGNQLLSYGFFEQIYYNIALGFAFPINPDITLSFGYNHFFVISADYPSSDIILVGLSFHRRQK